MGRNWTPANIELACSMREAGRSYYEIARAVGVTRPTVAYFFFMHPELLPPSARDVTQKNQQPCWRCAKASGGADCEWANSKCSQTVPGWTAKPVTHAYGATYEIIECPKFVEG